MLYWLYGKQADKPSNKWVDTDLLENVFHKWNFRLLQSA